MADERFEEPYVPVRTEFAVVLDQPIGTHLAAPTQTFTARVRHPIRSPENEIVIQSGAVVRGRIVAIEDKPTLHIKIRFDDVETSWGRAAVAATIRSADPYATSMTGMDGAPSYDAALYMPVSSTEADAAIGGGPRAWGPSSILLPKGAEIRLMLVKPLVGPPRARSLR